MKNVIKTILFNIAFIVYSVFWCFILMWAFFLPRKGAFWAVSFYFSNAKWIERIILGLDYRVTGRENIPEGNYVIAMKHQSTYETLKLMPIFGNMAVILKRELTRIPFWGWYTIKTGMIPVDRGGKGKALSSLLEGAHRVTAEGRHIVIFPQGTRVPVEGTTAKYPYKIGVAKIAEDLKMPILPVAVNSGVFWPKDKFLKRGGIVDFKILPPISPHQPVDAMLAQLEKVLEEESVILARHAATSKADIWHLFPRGMKTVIALLIILAVAWTLWWHAVADTARAQLANVSALNLNGTTISSPYQPDIDGFPLALHVVWPDITVTSPTSAVSIDALEASIWPLPGAPAEVFASGLLVHAQQDGRDVNLDFDNGTVNMRLPKIWQPRANWAVDIQNVALVRGESSFESTGTVSIPLNAETAYSGDMTIAMVGHRDWIDYFKDQNLIDDQSAGLAKGFMDAMAVTQGGTGRLSVPLMIKDNWVYVGPVRAFNLRPEAAVPEITPIETPALAPVPESVVTPPQSRPDDSGSISPLDLNPQILPSDP